MMLLKGFGLICSREKKMKDWCTEFYLGSSFTRTQMLMLLMWNVILISCKMDINEEGLSKNLCS